jgi:soluble lytic murein transglycosylase
MHRKVSLALIGVSLATVAAAAAQNTPQVVSLLPAALQAPVVVQRPVPAPPSPVYSVSPVLRDSLARWNSLRQSDSYPFSSYASFLRDHRGWPGETALRKTAEKAQGGSPGEVIAFFANFPPLTPAGHARLAFALHANGRVDEARASARSAWQAGVLPAADETRLLAQFGSALGPGDHDRRMDVLLANGDRQSAQRTLPYVSSARRAYFETRLALQNRSSDAASRLLALGPSYTADAGLLMDRANWLRNTNQSLAARQILAQRPRLSQPPVNAESWFETLLTMARAAATDNQWTIAYDIASKLDDAYPAGTDVSARPYGERDAYTSLAWIAGTTAMQRLARPGEAARMFDLYARAARSPQTRSKGFYWAARAAHGAGRIEQSNSWLEQAASAPDQFYGQLALERLGRRVQAPPATPVSLDVSARSAFYAKPLVQATRALGQLGQWSDQTLFVRALAQSAETDSERALAADFGKQIGRPDLGVWVAREARTKGANFYARDGFPEVRIPASYAHNWALAHGITRQESSFDRAAVSSAGARGMMQLMPGTAREEAGKIGLTYDFGNLTADPAYNVMLGSSYFARLLDQWGGNAILAIASYNAGAGNVRRWVRENGDPRTPGVDPIRWIESIPFSETRNYVQRVLENAVVYETINPQRTSDRNRLSYYLGKSGPG